MPEIDDSWKDPEWENPSWDMGAWRKTFRARAEHDRQARKDRVVVWTLLVCFIVGLIVVGLVTQNTDSFNEPARVKSP